MAASPPPAPSCSARPWSVRWKQSGFTTLRLDRVEPCEGARHDLVLFLREHQWARFWVLQDHSMLDVVPEHLAELARSEAALPILGRDVLHQCRAVEDAMPG